MTKNPTIFSDLDISFSAHPITGQLQVLTNANAVKRAVKNLVLTNRYEKLLNPNIFSDVTGSLFELLDSGDQVIIRQGIEDVLKNFEPRIQVLAIEVEEDLDHSGLNVSIAFELVNQPEPIVVNMFLERIR